MWSLIQAFSQDLKTGRPKIVVDVAGRLDRVAELSLSIVFIKQKHNPTAKFAYKRNVVKQLQYRVTL